MSKYLYVIIPVVLMVAFIGIYIHEKNVMERIAIEEKTKADAQAAADAKHMEELRAKSAEEARKAAADRDAAQAAKDQAKLDAFNAAIKTLNDAADGYIADQNKSKAQIADLESQIAKIRADKESLSRQYIDMNQTIVASLIDRQRAETEVQRFAQMVARRAADSPLARPPVAATPATPAQ